MKGDYAFKDYFCQYLTSVSPILCDVTGAADVSCSKNPEDCQEGPHVDDQTILRHLSVTTGLILCSSSLSPHKSQVPGMNISHPHLARLYRSVQRGGKISHLEKICHIEHFFKNL